MHTLRLLDATAVRRLLPMRDAIALMRDAFVAAIDPRTIMPIRQADAPVGARARLGVMHGYAAQPATFGIKVVGIPTAPAPGAPSHPGIVVLFDQDSGCPVVMLDAHEITAIRTAAATAAATDVLARRDAERLAVLGCGEQARTHLLALTHVRAFRSIVVWGRDADRARAFATEMSEVMGRQVSAAASAEAAVREADVICTTTTAAEPILAGAWLPSGAHLNAVGSSIPATSEIDVEAIARSRVFVDFPPSAVALAGDLARARTAGVLPEGGPLTAVGEVIAGSREGRRSAGEITLFKSLGMIIQDIASADFVYRASLAAGIGVEIPWDEPSEPRFPRTPA